jgi:hypothetical protein
MHAAEGYYGTATADKTPNTVGTATQWFDF